jgi:hypothetical protein
VCDAQAEAKHRNRRGPTDQSGHEVLLRYVSVNGANTRALQSPAVTENLFSYALVDFHGNARLDGRTDVETPSGICLEPFAVTVVKIGTARPLDRLGIRETRLVT